MIEILPNWHPIFVHFSIALLTVATFAYGISMMVGEYATRFQARQFARWTLWLGVGFSVLTIAAGMYAYFTVGHDGPSHKWMTIHRNVALPTFAVFAILAIWSVICARGQADEKKGFMSILVLAFVALLATSWLGGELVYRYGLGVQSLPEVSGEGHDHDHGDGGHDHGSAKGAGHDDLMQDMNMSLDEKTTESHEHSHKDNKPHEH